MRRLLVLFLLAIPAALAHAEDLRLDCERESLIATYRHYTQYIYGLPVIGGEVIERIDRDGSVHELHRALAQPAPKRQLLAKAAALSALPAGTVRDEQMVAVNVDGVARPAWRIVVEERPHEPYAHYVDAETGALLRSQALFFRAAGRVFDPNPVAKLNDPTLRDQNGAASAVPDAAYSIVDLPDLPSSGMLIGPNVQIIDTDAPFTVHADASQPLMFDRSQPQFAEVNAYFHLDRSQRYLQSLGYVGTRRLVNYSVPVDPHALGGADNSLFSQGRTPGQGTLYFGDGGVDDAEDSDIMLHEFGHVIQEWIAPGAFFGSSSSQSRALAEGIADYWSFSSNYIQTIPSGRDPYCIADWDARCGGDDPSQECGYPIDADCLRRVDGTKTMADYINSDTSGTEHRNGEIWSSAMREIFDGLTKQHGVDQGRRMTDTLVIESMFGAPPNPTFAAIAKKLVAADHVLNGGLNATAICKAITSRGILAAADCDHGPRGEVTYVQSAQHGLPIPDNTAAGITSTLDVSDTRSIDRLAVSVNIVHPSRGDLQIILIAPDGTNVILQNPSLDRTPSAQVTFGVDTESASSLDVLHGRPANGTWRLTVRDLNPGSSGTLLSWSLGITFVGDAPAPMRPFSFASRKHIAAVAHAPGALGTSWVSDVRIYNGGTSIANVTAVFTPSGQEGWNHFAAVKLTIASKQVVALDDIVASAMQSAGVGQLELLGDSDNLVVTSRTYTSAGGGTYGQFIPAVSTADAATLAYAPQLQSSADFRSNAGFAEVTGNSGVVHLTLFDGATGNVISQQDFNVQPFEHTQFAVDGAALMTAELRVVSGEVRIIAYGSVVDNRTGDPIYIAATQPQDGSAVAPVISAPGALNTSWLSDLFITAPGANGGGFSLTYVDAATGERITKQGSVAARQAIHIADVVGTYFGRPGAFGAIRADLPGSLIVTSRTFTSSLGGTYGQFIPLARSDEGFAPLAPGGAPRQLLQTERSAAFRTNLGAINTGGSNALIRFTVYDASGHALGSSDRTVGPLQAVQFPLDAITPASLVDGRVEVQLISGSVGAVAWASVIDNVTGDPIFVPVQ